MHHDQKKSACLRQAVLLLLLGLWAQLSAAAPDYQLLDDLLLSHVDNGFVDYDGLALDPRLDQFIAQLDETSPEELDTPGKLKAFYINAYNVIAIRGILDGRSPETWFGRNRFFKRMKTPVLGKKMNLEDIEHGELRPLGDARIHFAIVCASLSCPRLHNRAFLPATIDAQLTKAAEKFLNDPTRNLFDADRRLAFVSKIFEWFEEDFVARAGSVQNYMARYVSDQSSARLLRSGDFELRYDDYDWSLNGRLTRR